MPDGTVLELPGLCLAVLGGVEEEGGAPGLDAAAYQSLLDLGPGRIDVLVTHEGPYGSSVGYHGDLHGSPLISQLIARTKPAFHVAGHAHQFRGLQRFGPTSYLGLDGIVASPRWFPDARGLQPGSLALLDTARGELTPVADPWLASIDRAFDFDAWAERFIAAIDGSHHCAGRE